MLKKKKLIFYILLNIIGNNMNVFLNNIVSKSKYC